MRLHERGRNVLLKRGDVEKARGEYGKCSDSLICMPRVVDNDVGEDGIPNEEAVSNKLDGTVSKIPLFVFVSQRCVIEKVIPVLGATGFTYTTSTSADTAKEWKSHCS